MSTPESHPLRGATDYDSVAASLLAEIADSLLDGKRDWNVLARLQAALVAPKGKAEIVPSAMDAVRKSYVDHIAGTYDEKVRRELMPEPKFGGISYGYVNTFNNTANPSRYYWKRDDGKT